MVNLHKKIELLANIAIIVVALLLGGVLVKRYLLPGQQRAAVADDAGIKPGMKLVLPGVDWANGDRTLLLVLSTSCRYCTESAPFYRRLAQERAGHAGARLLAVLPQSTEEGRKYLEAHGVAVDDVRQSVPGATYARATPTLILVDRSGSVVASWLGKLPPDAEGEVLNRFVGTQAGD